MALAFKKGDMVRQVVPVIEGEVMTLAIVDDAVQYLVRYTDASGEVHERYFTEEELALK